MAHMTVSRQLRVQLTRSGEGAVDPTLFEVQEAALADPAVGEVVVEVHHFSLDPYQRIRMRFLGAGGVPPAGMVGRVVASRSDQLSEGAWVIGDGLWADHLVVPADRLTVVEPHPEVPLHHHVGLLGLTGLTAFFGVTEVARPQPGEKVAVTGAYGGVGQVASQIARLAGADVLGLVGSPEKITGLEGLGVAALSYADPEWTSRLAAWAPEGVDVLFDNVWGQTAARVVEQLKPLGRIALCGQMSSLASTAVPPLPIDDWFRFVTRSLTMRGFRGADFAARFQEGREQLVAWYLSGELRQEVDVARGLVAAGATFADLVDGRLVGKAVVDVRAS
jgi:NADPH-dependent curcumin reductase CurA